jgi:ribulose-5-phosphate 4-epimerase/fuculose-1-phosphate aldolase
MTEGTIKFNCIWQKSPVNLQEETYLQLESSRSALYALGLIGMYPDGIGFGNISVRSEPDGSFIITGSATGGLTLLEPSDYAKVTHFQFSENTIFCTGMTKASAESMTHAAVYQSLPDTGAVVHVHCLWLWEKLLNQLATTSTEIEYGTPEMAQAVGKLALEVNTGKEKIIVMGGHREGILTFGSSLMEATAQIINLYNRYKI